MNVLVFGASGRTGRHLVDGALERGMPVTAFVRDPAKLPVTHERLRVFRGDVADAGAVRSAMPGHDAVLSALGVGRPLKHDPAVISGIGHIVTEMGRSGVGRIVYLSFIGVARSRRFGGPMIRYIARWPLKHEIADHEAKERVLMESGLDWTIVAAPGLSNGPRTRSYRTGADIAGRSFFPMLSRADVADGMLEELERPRFIRNTLRLLP